MYIESHGSGADVVLIHGWAMHGGIFRPLTDALAQNYRVHVVDLPGHGFSADDHSHFELPAIAARLTRLLPPSVWIGWSLGGLLAMNAAIEHPQLIRGLGVIAASPRFVTDADWPHAVSVQIFEKFGVDLQINSRTTLERFLALELHGDEYAQSGLRLLKKHLFERGEPAFSVLQEGLRTLSRTDLRDRLSRIACPNVWLAGSRDLLVPAPAMEWAATIANGRFWRIDKAGHAPFLTHLEEVRAGIDMLMRATEAAS